MSGLVDFENCRNLENLVIEDDCVLEDDAAVRSAVCPFSVGTASKDHWDRVVQFITAQSKQHYASAVAAGTSNNNYSSQLTMTCYIPTASVGAVIGRRGQTVAALQKSAAQAASTHQPVRVSVVAATKEQQQQGNNGSGDNMNPTALLYHSNYGSGGGGNSNNNNNTEYHTVTPLDWSDPAWTPVVIRADAPAVCHAAQGLVELLAKAPGAPSLPPAAHVAAQCAHLLMDQVILDVPIKGLVQRQQQQQTAAADSLVSWCFETLLGTNPRGQTLATLSADAAVRIMVPPVTPTHHHHHHNNNNDLIQLEGDLWNVLVCLANLMNLFVGTQEPQRPKQVETTNGNNNNNTSTISLSALPSQTKLRNIARKTDCQIRKQRKSNTLTVTAATPQQVHSAVQLLKKWEAAQQQSPNTENTATPDTPRTAKGAPGRGGGRRANSAGNNNNNKQQNYNTAKNNNNNSDADNNKN